MPNKPRKSTPTAEELKMTDKPPPGKTLKINFKLDQMTEYPTILFNIRS